MKMIYTCAGPKNQDGRRGCGADLTAQIEAVPEDGAVYEYKCPACGNTGTVRRTKPADEAAA